MTPFRFQTAQKNSAYASFFCTAVWKLNDFITMLYYWTMHASLCFNCLVDHNKNVWSAEEITHTKDARVDNLENLRVQNCNGPHVASYKGCPECKKQAFKQHVVNNQKTYASVVTQNTFPQAQKPETFTFTAEQLAKFVANVVIQIAQPQVCYPNPKQDTLDLKSSMCRKVSNAAKNILGVDITEKDLFESIGSLSAPAPPKPFTFTSAKVNSTSKSSTKPLTLKSTSPPSNSTKAVPKQPKTSK